MRVAQPSMSSRKTTSIQPPSTSRAIARTLVPRGARPGNVSEKTKSARITYGPSKGTPRASAETARVPMATTGSTSIRTSAARPSGP